MPKKKLVRVPLAGNAYLIEKSVGSGKISAGGISNWTSPDAVFAIYVRFKSAVSFDAAIKTRAQTSSAVVSLSALGVTCEAELEEGYREAMFGSFSTEKGGYVKFELRGVSKTGETFASPSELLLYGITEDDVDAYVPTTQKNNFYWTRRGPSVHCGYDISEFGDVEWFYNEVVVPKGSDHVGLYAMAIGFNGGYFGIQVNSKSERKILFSIWSPYVTDHPEEIPEEDRVICLGRHENTHIGEFGGEGSGGQSYMKYRWKAGVAYKFLMRVKPAENNRTEFTAYFFFPETGKFERIASFSRPKTQSYLQGPHSFLENFHDTKGFLARTAYYGNQWARTANGEWKAPSTVRFTADATARNGWRKDFDGGVLEDGRFFLRHCGFIDETQEIGKTFQLDVSSRVKPDIDLETLTRE